MHGGGQEGHPPAGRRIEHPHASRSHSDGALRRSADRHGIVDDRRKRDQAEQEPAEPQRQNAEHRDDDVEKSGENRDDYDIDEIGPEPSSEGALGLAQLNGMGVTVAGGHGGSMESTGSSI